jgi:hypothetical protein
MSRRQSQSPRKPATKFTNLQKKIRQQHTQTLRKKQVKKT